MRSVVQLYPGPFPRGGDPLWLSSRAGFRIWPGRGRPPLLLTIADPPVTMTIALPLASAGGPQGSPGIHDSIPQSNPDVGAGLRSWSEDSRMAVHPAYSP